MRMRRGGREVGRSDDDVKEMRAPKWIRLDLGMCFYLQRRQANDLADLFHHVLQERAIILRGIVIGCVWIGRVSLPRKKRSRDEKRACERLSLGVILYACGGQQQGWMDLRAVITTEGMTSIE